ncbi:hypothetical protein CEP53_014464 [Fusarium sp. AF-6]|nr:hypothetical protein CEP53_014464 [Fusarium sp. AF-6]
MCSHTTTTPKASANTKALAAKAPTANAPVDMANPVCSCTKCACRNIVTFPGGDL